MASRRISLSTRGLCPVNANTLDDATLVETELRKVTVRGQPGIVRVWAPQGSQNMYSSRFPTVIVNWFEADLLWTVQSTFLSVDEALAVAESIQPTEVG